MYKILSQNKTKQERMFEKKKSSQPQKYNYMAPLRSVLEQVYKNANQNSITMGCWSTKWSLNTRVPIFQHEKALQTRSQAMNKREQYTERLGCFMLSEFLSKKMKPKKFNLGIKTTLLKSLKVTTVPREAGYSKKSSESSCAYNANLREQDSAP